MSRHKARAPGLIPMTLRKAETAVHDLFLKLNGVTERKERGDISFEEVGHVQLIVF